MLTLVPFGPDAPRGNCADPTHWPLVDTAFTRPGGDAGQEMTRTLCTGCPLLTRCLDHAMRHREHGIWGGTTPTARTRHGAPGGYEAEARRLGDVS